MDNPQENLVRASILVVDDNPANLQLLASILRQAGYAVRVAASGDQALRSLAIKPADLLLLDIRMPGLGGIDTCKALKARPEGADMPVIFISALSATEDKLAAFSAGGVDYITKPFSTQEVLTRVGNHLDLLGLRRDLERQVALRTRELSELKARYQDLYDAAPCGYHSVDAKGLIVEVNQTELEMLGYRRDEVVGRMNVRELFSDAGRRLFAVRFPRFLREGVLEDLEIEMRRKDGSRFWANINATAMRDAEGNILYSRSTFTDITERKQAEEKLRRAASVFTHAREGIMITDPKGKITEVNDAFCRISGYARQEILGEHPRILKSDRHPLEFYRDLWHSLLQDGHWQGEIWNRGRYGDYYVAQVTISAIPDEKGETGSYIALYTDITTEKEQQRQLQHIAHFDALTNLPNRILLADRLAQAMVQNQRRKQWLAVAYLDLDGFKVINDRHGHDVGDELLVIIAHRLRRVVRGGDTIARIGGDEFVAVLGDLPAREASDEWVGRLLEAASEPAPVDGLTLQLSASVGVTFYPQAEEVDGDQLIRQADQAMYQAKLAGKNRHSTFDAEQDRDTRGIYESLQRIEQALAGDEFILYYQPKVNMRSGKVIGVEALIRWQHPEQGLLPPAAFLPVVERHPLAIDIGQWVIDTAMSQIEAWRAAGRPLPISVNVGARQLQDEHFVDHLRQALARHPELRPGDLELEVLETSALENIGHVAQMIRDCRELGIDFALDDFGTGYSSLTYLKRLPVSQLKIDQSFVRDMLDDPEDLAILDGVMGLASAFRQQYIAEGVETIEHGCMLLMLGYQLGQGYGIARPMPARALEEWLIQWRPPESWIHCRRLSRDDLPLLYAAVEHNAWIRRITEYAGGARAALPPLEITQCRFGQWLTGAGKERYGEHAIFPEVVRLHDQIHGAAKRLLGIAAEGVGRGAAEDIGELYQLKERLLELLRGLA